MSLRFRDYQFRVFGWVCACFGLRIAEDPDERNERFLEEALELVQARGMTRERAQARLDEVFGRNHVGQTFQEVGGVMVTLAALCHADRTDLITAAEAELSRVWGKVEEIRSKQRRKAGALTEGMPDSCS
jgi:hypothetical protein